MYQLQTAFLRKKGTHGFPVEMDVSNISIITVLTDYDLGHLELSNPAISGTVYLDILELRSSSAPFRDQTVSFWLGTLGNLGLGGTTVPINYRQQKYVRFVDGWNHGIVARRASPYREDAEGLLPAEAPDAIVEFKDGDYEHVQRNCCFVIGGYGHYSEPSISGVRIKDAARTMDSTADNAIGILNFTDVGEVSLHRMTDAMIKAEPGISLYDVSIINLGRDLTNKSVMVFIAGILHGEHDILKVVNRKQGIVRIEMHKLDLVTQVALSMDVVDFSSVDFYSLSNPGNVNNDRLKSDVSIRGILKLPQSFVVVIDAPIYDVGFRIPEQSAFNGRTMYPDTVDRVGFPLIDTFGRFLSFMLRKEPFSIVQIFRPLDGKTPAVSTDNQSNIPEFFSGGEVDQSAFKTVRPMLIGT